ncbi:MAG: YihY/virulence factor BrkB family protein [Nodosilinea sp.]
MKREPTRSQHWCGTCKVRPHALLHTPLLRLIRARIRHSLWVRLMARTLVKWQQDDGLEMGAALAYYGVFSLFPILLVMLSIAGFLMGPNTTTFNTVLNMARQSLPPDAFGLVETTLMHFHTGSRGAGIVGSTILFFSASGFFGALSRAFDKIWRVEARHDFASGFGAIAFTFIWRRSLSFLLVMGLAALVLLSLLSNIAVDSLLPWLDKLNSLGLFSPIDRVQILPRMRLLSSFVILNLVVMVLYKILPRTRIAWRDIWLGAFFTASLWLILQQLISNSVISLGSRFRSYGVLSGFMVLMLWIYLTSQIFFLGGQLTYVYAHLLGSRKNYGLHLRAKGRLDRTEPQPGQPSDQ